MSRSSSCRGERWELTRRESKGTNPQTSVQEARERFPGTPYFLSLSPPLLSCVFAASPSSLHHTTPHTHHTTPHHQPHHTKPHRTAPHRTAPHRTAPPLLSSLLPSPSHHQDLNSMPKLVAHSGADDPCHQNLKRGPGLAAFSGPVSR